MNPQEHVAFDLKHDPSEEELRLGLKVACVGAGSALRRVHGFDWKAIGRDIVEAAKRPTDASGNRRHPVPGVGPGEETTTGVQHFVFMAIGPLHIMWQRWCECLDRDTSPDAGMAESFVSIAQRVGDHIEYELSFLDDFELESIDAGHHEG